MRRSSPRCGRPAPPSSESLTRAALRRFGPAYYVRVFPFSPEACIRGVVLLGVRYPVRAASALIEELRRFAGEVEVAIAEGIEPALPEPIAVTAELDEASTIEVPDEDEDEASQSSGWDRVVPILGAVATGVGVLGFVTFVGGAIEWARFGAAGLPREEALSIVPTQDLVVIGANTLVPAVAYGLLATAVYLIGLIFFGRREERIPDPAERSVVERNSDAVRALVLVSVVALFEVLAFTTTIDAPGTAQYVSFILLGTVMVALTYSVARVTSSPLFLAGTVFLALSLFLGGVEYVRAQDTPELRGAAIVRNNERAIIGFFVAENGSRVYLARLADKPLEREEIDQSSARLIGIQKDQITDISVASPRPPAEALEQAQQLADELCELETPLDPAEKKVAPPPNCWSKPPGELTGGDDGEGGNRTHDTTIFSRVLYQLSYLAWHADGTQREG